MKKLTIFFILGILIISINTISAVNFGSEIPIDGGLDVSNTPPSVFKCQNTIYYDDFTEIGRVKEYQLIERKYSSLFEGEQIYWKVLVYNIDRLNNLKDVTVTIGKELKPGNGIEVNCLRSKIQPSEILETCNLRDLETYLKEFDSEKMAYYDCTLTIETLESMYGKYWITVEAEDIGGHKGIMSEAEQWFLNPIIAISSNDSIRFRNLEAGKTSYSNEIEIKNEADEGSGVILDMFISGTDFYSENANSFCPEKQKLGLDNFKYFAKNENYDTTNLSDSDNEGYRPLKYGWSFNSPTTFYNYNEVIPKAPFDYPLQKYYQANVLDVNGKLNLIFKLSLPPICKGNFDSGNIFIWAEAI